MAAALADGLGEALLRVAELLHEPAVALGFLERAQILALDVLDEGDFERFAVLEFADDDRDFVELCHLRRAPAPLAGDDLVGVRRLRMAPHEKRLQHALLADRLGERLQRLLVEALARLEAAGPHEIDRHRLRLAQAVERCVILALFAEQGREAAAEIAPASLLAHRKIPLKARLLHARDPCSRRSTSLAR